MISLLRAHRVLICAGTGGVGKPSMSASLGVLAAQEGLKTLVLTIDPAHRLAQALGLESRPGEEVPVTAVPGLSAVMIDPRREFDEFVLGSVDKGIARELFNNRLYQQLVSNLNGSQEFTSLVTLNQAVRSGKYDLVILDTPPTQNAVDFLRAPERLYALFQDTVIGWFAESPSEKGWIQRTLHRGTRLVSGALESVTGSTFIQELKDFFSHIAHLNGRIAEISQQTQSLLHSKDCGFVLVTGFDAAKLKEALEFHQDLNGEGLNLRAVIVNRWFPEWTEGEQHLPAHWTSDSDFTVLKELHERFVRHYAHRQLAYQEFATSLGHSVPVVKLPEFTGTIQGVEDLKAIADILKEKWRSL